MLSLVFDQVDLIRKSRPAAVADMPLNATVSPLLVLGQPGLSHKTRAAAVTDIRLLPCMRSRMYVQGAFLREAFPTARVVACVRLLTCVSA